LTFVVMSYPLINALALWAATVPENLRTKAC
jgi:hypothetical protein